eukprot:7332102-Pyramimonas_sp.AAC.1
MTARLMDEIDCHKTTRIISSAVHLSVDTRVDKGARTYVQFPKNGLQLDHVARQATMNPDDNTNLKGIQVQDQTT